MVQFAQMSVPVTLALGLGLVRMVIDEVRIVIFDRHLRALIGIEGEGVDPHPAKDGGGVIGIL